eukprot:TRINITY_DN15644_c0_g1_i1.p1 TRINITY_DN15644_c0_g1~~TRINITY_DN15644_c0_g1_i1.p1  ORF type:complete len:445 (+),score=165.39 TRINITY_DN15644_c0_g1_i1:90-1424(+)
MDGKRIRPDTVTEAAGTSAVVLIVPHDGDLVTEDVPDRERGCFEPDHDTALLGDRVRECYTALTGEAPALVRLRLHRKKLDGNRPRATAADPGSPALAVWDRMHDAIRRAIRAAVQRHGYCHVLDVHGQCHRRETELGYCLRNDSLRRLAAGKGVDGGSSSLRMLIERNGVEHAAEIVAGPRSFGGLLARGGYPCIPSPDSPHPCKCEGSSPCWQAAVEAGRDVTATGGGDCMYFWGGYNAAAYGRDGAEGLGCVAVTQMETSAEARECRGFPGAVAVALRDFMSAWYGERHPSPQFKLRSAAGAGELRYGVGVAVFVTSQQHPGCVLLAERLGPAAGAGTWALPGGHLDFGETIEGCAVRETLEEVGLHLSRPRQLCTLNTPDVQRRFHYVTCFVVGSAAGRPANREPAKHGDWSWVRWDDPGFPSQLFLPLAEFRRKGLTPL